jgi:hypothetical protein
MIDLAGEFPEQAASRKLFWEILIFPVEEDTTMPLLGAHGAPIGARPLMRIVLFITFTFDEPLTPRTLPDASARIVLPEMVMLVLP